MSDPEPDLRKNILPSGTFRANSPCTKDAVVGNDPEVKLLFNCIGMSYINIWLG